MGNAETALVDSGYSTHSAQTLSLVESSLNGRPLDRLLNTHLHSDHCGGNAALQARYPGLVTEIPPGEAEFVFSWNVEQLSYAATGQTCPRFSFSALLVPGTERELGGRAWQIHSAPGHDPHSVVLFEPQSSTLISADALWENGFGVAFPELAGEPSFDDIGATLDLIESLRPSTVIPGHGAIFDDVEKALSVARRRLDGLRRDPVKHARHAIKVLMKFKLLEMQEVDEDTWAQWVCATPYFSSIRDRFFPGIELERLSADVLTELIGAGVARRDAAGIHNV